MTQNKVYRSTINLSIRRRRTRGLPGDDSTLHNLKIGSSLNGKVPLSGLSFEEERLYLPAIISISPQDVEFTKAVRDYWNNISVPVPADGLGTPEKQGVSVSFTVEFTNKSAKEAVEATLDFEKKAQIISESGRVVDGIDDYVLFRYCLVYGRVANRASDVNRSPKIRFYLYSKEIEVKNKHIQFKLRREADNLFGEILTDDALVNALLLMFDQDLSTLPSMEDRHLVLETFVNSRSADFVRYVRDASLRIKAAIKTAVNKGILHNPSNTDSYYFGENNEVLLGATLEDAVLYWKTDSPKNQEIVTAIKARLKS